MLGEQRFETLLHNGTPYPIFSTIPVQHKAHFYDRWTYLKYSHTLKPLYLQHEHECSELKMGNFEY